MNYLVQLQGAAPWRQLSNGLDAYLYRECSRGDAVPEDAHSCETLSVALTARGALPRWSEVIDNGSIDGWHLWEATAPLWTAYKDTDFRVLAMSAPPVLSIVMVSPDADVAAKAWRTQLHTGKREMSLSMEFSSFCSDAPIARLVVIDRQGIGVFAEWARNAITVANLTYLLK